MPRHRCHVTAAERLLFGSFPLGLRCADAAAAPSWPCSVRVAATLDNTPGGDPTPAKAGDDVFIDPVVGSKRLSNYLCVR